MALLCEGSKLSDVNGKWLVSKLHELGEIEQWLQDFKRHVVGIECSLESCDERVLVALHGQLSPAREESGVEELSC